MATNVPRYLKFPTGEITNAPPVIFTDIHADFQKMPAMRSFINPWFPATVNTALNFAGANKWFKFRKIARQHKTIA